ncbi:hypothetical protein KXV85_006271, partial [Aspergillus fumigatus]
KPSPPRSRPAGIACIATSPSSSAARAKTSTICRSWSAPKAARASRCSSAPPPARCWSRTTPACAAFFGRSAAVPPSTPRTSTASTSARASASRAIRARIRSGATRPRRCWRRSGWSTSRARRESPSTCCISPPGRRSSICATTR